MNRQEKIQALLTTVRADGDGCYSVASLSLDGWVYTISPKTKTSPASCECDDYKHRAPKSSAPYRCIHILAVISYLKAQKAAKPPSIKANQEAMEEKIKVRMERQQGAPKTLSASDRYKEACELIESGEGNEWTEAQALSSWFEMIDAAIETIPEDFEGEPDDALIVFSSDF